MSIYFDNTLPAFIEILEKNFNHDFIEQGAFLRDSTGRLTFFSRTQCPPEIDTEKVIQSIVEILQSYVSSDCPIVFPDEYDDLSSILDSPERLPIQISDKFYYLIDRRIVGSGWLSKPSTQIAFPPRIVFASLKGGVGRSTALTVTAADLARRGRNILVVDLDLEAPGLGHILLQGDRLPEYGVIDYLVENGIGGIKEEDIFRFIGSSHLTDASGGRVDVMPALGKSSEKFPENVLAKLSRAMIEDVSDTGTISVGQQVSSMIEHIAASGYDAVLIDSRAGLAELSAPAVTGLGATVLLFGTSQTQTFEGYRALFSSLKLLAQRDLAQKDGIADWRSTLRPVYAKASLSTDASKRFQEEFYELYSEHLYDVELADNENTLEDSQNCFRYSRNELDAPHQPLAIPFSASFVDFDPVFNPDHLAAPFYEQAFRPFINEIDRILSINTSKDQP